MGKLGSEWHRITDVQPESNRATCSVCGPNTRVKYRRHQDRWSCFSIQGKRSPEGHRKNQLAAKRANRWRGIPGGMTPERYEEMLSAQGGVCAICEAPPEGKRLSVDHCHASEQIRGLLCSGCNLALGHMRDDPELLLRAAQYINNARTSA